MTTKPSVMLYTIALSAEDAQALYAMLGEVHIEDYTSATARATYQNVRARLRSIQEAARTVGIASSKDPGLEERRKKASTAVLERSKFLRDVSTTRVPPYQMALVEDAEELEVLADLILRAEELANQADKLKTIARGNGIWLATEWCASLPQRLKDQVSPIAYEFVGMKLGPVVAVTTPGTFVDPEDPDQKKQCCKGTSF